MSDASNRIHFIAIGGSVMHNLAVALKKAGHQVSGSDDTLIEPSRSVLETHGLLPPQPGWFPDRIDSSIDTVILGMHAQDDNPELTKAQSLGLRILSFPDYILERSREKQRIVIAGSHGKTTITAIIVHVLNHFNKKFDFVLGAKIKGLAETVRLSDAPIIIIEGDEYLSSRLDPVPKFLKYQHHIGLISGVAWDHANVFPTEEEYVKQFDLFSDQTPKGGILIYCEQDPLSLMIGKKERADVMAIGYKSHSHSTHGGKTFLTNGKIAYPIQLFGHHNLLNFSGAKEVLRRIGITLEQFYEAVASFEGAAGRLEKVSGNHSFSVYKDFAHAPSKVKASVKALRELHPSKELVSCLELHTYSSLNKKFLPQYRHSMKHAQQAIVFFDPEKVKSKHLDPISVSDIERAFDYPGLKIFTATDSLRDFLLAQSWNNKNLLMMSSGNFGGLSLADLSSQLKS